jgi:aarF domain-containing kinase
VEAKLRQILIELGNDDKILGIQVCMVPFFSDKVA